MELKELCEKALGLFNIQDIHNLKESLYEVVMNNDADKLKAFKNMVDNDLSIDWLQKIFQYYESDRKNKMQDYTPTSIAKLVAKLSKSNEIIDMCAGSGALTIQKWNEDKDTNFKLYEFDENVIPYLLFNLMIRNINATVYHKDVLSGETWRIYKLSSQKEFSKLEVI